MATRKNQMWRFMNNCEDGKITSGYLLTVLTQHQSFRYYVLKNIEDIELNPMDVLSIIHNLCRLEPTELELFISKFSKLMQKLTCRRSGLYFLREYVRGWSGNVRSSTKHMFRCTLILLRSPYGRRLCLFNYSDVIIEELVIFCDVFAYPTEKLFKIIVKLVNNGLFINALEAELIYRRFGEPLFNFVLRNGANFGVIDDGCWYSAIVRLKYDVRFEIEAVLSETSRINIDSLENLLNYTASPVIKEYCLKSGELCLKAKAEKLPKVPSLLELARNTARKFIVNTFNVVNPRQYYNIVDKLPIAPLHERILTFDCKIYDI